MTSTPATAASASAKVTTGTKTTSRRAAGKGSDGATAAKPCRTGASTTPRFAAPSAVTPSSGPQNTAPRQTKQHQLAALLLRDEGVTLKQMIAATGWLPHTTRAALTGLRKKGYAIDSDKVDGVRTYRAVAPQ